MGFFDSDGVNIHYEDVGEGPPILLIHGFGSNIFMNWKYPGWVDALVGSGRRVVAIDNRGHGKSEKLYDQQAYGAPTMAEDARRLLDHLAIDQVDVVGYSMGTRIAAFLSVNHPHRINRAVWGGMGIALVRGVGNHEPIAAALEAETVDDVTDPTGLPFRLFAEKTGSDRLALAACMRSPRKKLLEDDIAGISIPVLIAVGTKDNVAGSPAELAALMPNAEVLAIPDRDHMVAVGDKVFKEGALKFLESDR